MNEAAENCIRQSAAMQAGCIISILERNGRFPGEESREALRLVTTAIALATARGSICATSKDVAGETGNPDDATACSRIAGLLFREGLACTTGENSPPKSTADTGCCPVVIDIRAGETRFYNGRRFADEVLLATRIAELACHTINAIPGTSQDDAVRIACAERLAIICGGPGTGKTTVVRKVLDRLLSASPKLKILLAAPTGKAASRLQQAIRERSGGTDNAAAAIMGKLEASTIHRLLTKNSVNGERPSARNQLDADLLVVDECSMVDLDTAGRLFSVIDTNRTRVILIGDRHQLSAVGPGSVFSELSAPNGPLAANTTELAKSYRFDSSKGIGKLASAINAGSPETADILAALARDSRKHPGIGHDIRWERDTDIGTDGLTAPARRWIDSIAGVITGLNPPLSFTDEKERENYVRPLWKKLRDIGVLAAGRNGPMSVASLNSRAEAVLGSAGIKAPLWMPVIVRKNDESLGIHNGDIGLVIPGIGNASLDVWFDDDTGSPVTRKYGLLPQHETAFAITIHQSQGSEYHRVAVFLPLSASSELATRELFYTAVTRVRDMPRSFGSLTVFSTREVVDRAVRNPAGREGGLADRLGSLLSRP